jgi:hypothetical protein
MRRTTYYDFYDRSCRLADKVSVFLGKDGLNVEIDDEISG